MISMRRISFGIIIKSFLILLVCLNAVFFATPSISFAQIGIPVGNEVIGGGTPGTGTDEGTVLQNPTAADITQTQFNAATPGLPDCGIVPGDSGTVEGCFVRIFYYVLLYPSAWLASFAGQVFDWLIAFTLNATSYKNEFIEKGWAIIRDVINISFIFILLYTAIRFIVSNDRNSIGKTIAKIIMVAIVINFSLFVTRVIIDAGNILGRVLYEKMSVSNDDTAEQTGYITISAGLIGKVNPQKLLDGGMFQKKPTFSNQESSSLNYTVGAYSDVTGSAVEGTEVTTGFIILILLMATVINILLVWVFISVGIFLIGRTIGLWIMMILSPIAFASMGIPGVSSLGGQGIELSFLGWIRQTFKLSFLVVIFLFLLYLVIMFLDTTFGGLQNQFTTNQSTIQTMMSVFIPMGIIFFLLRIAVSQAKSMSGSFGDIVGKGLKMAMVGALGGAGLALGGAAIAGGVAGRQVLGRAGSRLAKGANTNTLTGRLQKRMGTSMAKGTWDARNVKIPGGSFVSKYGKQGFSLATGGVVSAGDFDIKTAGQGSKASYKQLKEDRIKKKIEKAKEYTMDENKTIDVNGTKTSVNKARENWRKKRDEVRKAEKYDEKKQDLEEMKEDLEKARAKHAIAKKEFDSGIIGLAEYDAIKNDLRAKKTAHDTQKSIVKLIEDQWKTEADFLKAAEKRLQNLNNQAQENYAQSLKDWSPVGFISSNNDGDKAAGNQILDSIGKGEKDKKP